MDFASAFGTYLEGGRVLLGRDTRFSSPLLHAATVSSLLSTGCEIVDLGVCPVPVLQHAVPGRNAAGGVAISGGHNGMGWNALTLIDRRGAVLEPAGGEAVLDLFHAGSFRRSDWSHLGSLRSAEDYFGAYLESLARHVDPAPIRSGRFTVLVDPVGGSGCPFLQPFAEWLGLDLVPINGVPSGYLAREAEPRPRAASQMASIIGRVGGHVGFVHSSDVGRMSLVTEKGEPASEEYTLAVIADHVLCRHPGTLVTNCCTTRTVDDVAARHRARIVKTKVGQAHVVAALADEQGVLGGEGSGSACLPAFSPAFDGFLMMALVLEAMAQNGATASELLERLPRYKIVKRSRPCVSQAAYHAVERLRDWLDTLGGARSDETDGIRIDWPDGWIHVRPSHTEQILRVISESVEPDQAENRAREALRIVEQSI
jgi:phosphomannomutase